jgi:hypothetical protein
LPTLAFTNQGQVCLAGSRVFIERPVYDRYVEAVVAKVSVRGQLVVECWHPWAMESLHVGVRWSNWCTNGYSDRQWEQRLVGGLGCPVQVSSMKVGDPKAADTDLGPVSSLQHREKVGQDVDPHWHEVICLSSLTSTQAC